MKITPKSAAAALVLSGAVACAPGNAPGDVLKLSDGWTLREDGTSARYPATVPGTVAGALFDCGELPSDLYENDTYAGIDRARFDNPWWYTTNIALGRQKGQHYFLKFEGIDYRADIFFNRKQLAAAEEAYGVFNHFEYDVTDLVRGNNRLEVKVYRAQPGDLNIGYVDWNPRPLGESVGLWRDVTVSVTGDLKMDDVFVKPAVDLETLESAELQVSCTLTNLADKAVEGTLRGSLEGAEFSVPVSLAAGERREVVLTSAEVPALHVDNPRLWWCQPLGEPALYQLSLDCYAGEALSDCEAVTFGIRDVRSWVDEDGARHFSLNGVPLVIRGAGWTDDLLLRDTPASIETQVRYVKDMNLNCIRFENIWGKDRTVYEMCDKYGILAMVGWSCQWEWKNYCGLPETDPYGCINTPEDMALAASYFEYQVKWLRNHPSVFVWLVGSDTTPNPELERMYLDIFGKLDYRPYVNSAARRFSTVSGPSGMKMNGPYDFEGPDYWYLDRRNGGAFGFNTETGIGLNMPAPESLQRMMPADSLWPLSKTWNFHCTNAGGMNRTDRLVRNLTGLYGAPTDFMDFVKKGQAADYDGTRAMFEAFRANEPASTGIIQWMLNSAWPSVYWQLYDWYLVPTAGYYGTKKANEPLQAVFNYADNSVYAVNATGTAAARQLSAVAYDVAGNPVFEEIREADFLPGKPEKVFDLSELDGEAFFLFLKIEGGADNAYCIPAKDNVYSRRAQWYVTPIESFSDMGFVTRLPKVDVAVRTEKAVVDGNTVFTVTLENRSAQVAYQNVLSLKSETDGRLVTPAFWSDNYFSLEPHASKTVTCTVDGGIDGVRVDFRCWNGE